MRFILKALPRVFRTYKIKRLEHGALEAHRGIKNLKKASTDPSVGKVKRTIYRIGTQVHTIKRASRNKRAAMYRKSMPSQSRPRTVYTEYKPYSPRERIMFGPLRVLGEEKVTNPIQNLVDFVA
jgi:hypothetical protein